MNEPTPMDVAKKVAKEFGITLTDEDADYVLWEETGYPCFFMSDDPLAEMEVQLRVAFRQRP